MDEEKAQRINDLAGWFMTKGWGESNAVLLAMTSVVYEATIAIREMADESRQVSYTLDLIRQNQR